MLERPAGIWSRRELLKKAAAAATATGLTWARVPVRARSAQRVRFILDWIPKGQTSPFYVALHKGFWAELGLDVQVSRGFGSGDTAARVGRGEAEFGWAGVSAVMSTISQGLPLLEVAATAHTHPTAIFSLPQAGIKGPKDLVGKRGADSPAGENRALIRAYYAQQGLDYEKDTRWLYVQGAGMQQILSGQADFVPDWITNLPEWWLQNPPLNPNTLWIGKALNIYGNGIITTPAFLQKNRDVARRFVEGALEGYRYVIENGPKAHEEAIDILFQYNPELEVQPNAREFHLGNLKLFLSLMLTDETRAYGIGYFVPEKVNRTMEFINKYLLSKPLTVDQAFNISPQLLREGQLRIRNFDAAAASLSEVLGRPNPVLSV